MSPEAVSRHVLADVVECASDVIVITDGSGRILFVNRQVSAVFGYDPAEMVGQRAEMLVPERFRARYLQLCARYMKSPRPRSLGRDLDLLARRKDGSEFPIEIGLSPLADGGRTVVAATIRDITLRRHIERELVRARHAAERASHARTRYLATASHDLRQPLHSIALWHHALCRLVTDGPATGALAQQGQAIELMSRLFDSLLDIGRLDSGAITPDLSDFPVALVLNQIRQEFSSLAASKGLELQLEGAEQTVRSDPSLLGQVLRNLVSNAIKYTAVGRVRVSCLSQPDAVRIEVVDTGVGIPADQLAYIYEEFYQVEGPPRTPRDGYGLGLSIVQRLLPVLDVNLEVQSEVGRGSTFALKVPRATSNRSRPPRVKP